MRIRLQLPETVLCKTQISVRATDMNYAGHLGNDRILAYAQECRHAWLDTKGMNELDVHGASIVVADAAIQFQAEGFVGDNLCGTLYLGEPNKYGFDLYYQFENQNGVIVATVKTAILFRENGSLCSPPKGLFNT